MCRVNTYNFWCILSSNPWASTPCVGVDKVRLSGMSHRIRHSHSATAKDDGRLFCAGRRTSNVVVLRAWMWRKWRAGTRHATTASYRPSPTHMGWFSVVHTARARLMVPVTLRKHITQITSATPRLSFFLSFFTTNSHKHKPFIAIVFLKYFFF